MDIPLEGYLDSFQFGVLGNKAAKNICVQVFVWIYIFISLRQTIKSLLLG